MVYTEHPYGSPLVVCTWEQTTGGAHEQRVVPDACVDVIWNGRRLMVAGPDTTARLVALPPSARLVGIRLAPGAAGALLGMPASELRDQSPDATDVFDVEDLVHALDSGSDPHLLLRQWASRGSGEPDPLVGAAVAALGRPRARVAAVAADLGVSARQLQRLVTDAVGYGPKVLARVLRLRRLQTLAPAPLAELALDAGYADQAHMTAEVTALAGISPVRFLKDRTPQGA